ncbi:ATP-binding region ATPase domain protein [Bacteroides coprosuis DSM 18011]|uniref:ATP-binding region ATPase domain protein n=1 Tax=Bacteroides coprosuis DSM 18011 TaxID=679937 RepID=F3ZTA7_9BACE|nr:ATP-binding protein [Bacteroides coprosuis]EGJ72275.1 ATP-binding region ATPase domain protein [Bacteroides coprosuis DSM 18011]
MEEYKSTSIWKNTLGKEDDENHSEKIEELRSAFITFRKNASVLISRISSILPDLTQHEISHLDSLWDTASLIVGEDYLINPLEAFILGGAILIHDSALCFEAYENGQDGIRATHQWKDAFAELQLNSKKEDIDKLKNQADFTALRELHAIQAEVLLEKSWRDPDNGQELYLLENQTLRKHLGKLIGQIASSHHWDIEQLATKLSIQQNSLPSFPREWRIDPVKIACILRCADAAHLDNLRAPDFLYALIKRNGISLNHWQAQNRISRVDIDQTDPNKETLLFNSSIDFKEEDSASWFVAYDAICLVEKEIRSCNSLLSQRSQNLTFKVKKVKGIESPEKLSEYIKVDNWKPCSAKVHVGNIERLIDNLGGELLYGSGSDLLGVTIRELIQNSRDAIFARSFVEKHFTGKITIRVEKIHSDTFLTVEDNGVGMSERVLTGPLLDFGTSFWTSSLIKSEFPGLRSSGFKSIGKFGIGFYSIFMIADSVFVESRNWKDGLSEILQLKFKEGFTLRPILKKGLIEGFPSSVSTRIKLKLKTSVLSDDLMIEIITNRMGSKNFNVPFSSYLSALTAGLDVEVLFVGKDGMESKIHTPLDSPEFDKTKWLNTISFSDYRIPNHTKAYIDNNIERLKPIIVDNMQLGLAAISTTLNNEQDFLSVSTVGGLAHSVHGRDSEYFVGYIDFNPKSAKREVDDFAGNETHIQDWARDQLKDLLNFSLNPIEKYSAASSLCHFKVDPSELAMILVSINKQQIFYTFDQLADLSLKSSIAFLESGFGGHIETHHSILDLPNYALIRPLNNSSFLSLKFSEGNKPEENKSILDCLYRKIVSKGYDVSIDTIHNIGVNSFNQSINAIVVSSKIK